MTIVGYLLLKVLNIDIIASWWNGKLMFDVIANWQKLQVDEMTSKYILLMKWLVDIEGWWNGKLWNGTLIQFAKLTKFQMMKWQVHKMSSWWNGKLAKWQ